MRSTQDKYTRVPQKQDENQSRDETEFKISTRTGPSLYIKRVIELFTGDETKQVKPVPSITLSALGNAISKALMVSEIVRRRVKGLYQYLTIGNTEIKDVYEPTEKGLDTVVQTRVLSMITIKLTINEPTSQDRSLPGFQDKIPDSEVEQSSKQRDEQQENRRNGGQEQRRYGPRQSRGRGGRGGRENFRGGRGGRESFRGGRGGRRSDNRDDRRDTRRSGSRDDRRDTRNNYDDRRDNRNNYDDRRDNRTNYDNRRGDNKNYDDRRRDNRNNYDDRRDNRNNYQDRRDNRNQEGERRKNYDDRRDNRNQRGQRRDYDNNRPRNNDRRNDGARDNQY